MFVLGLGLGLVMQVLVLAVQNAVGYDDLGVATSGATLFRSIGGSVGTAVLGSIFSNRLAHELTVRLPAGAAHSVTGSAGANPAALDRLPAPVHAAYVASFTHALNTVFEVAAGVAAFAFLLSWALEQRPLRDTVAAGSGVGESFAVPKHTDSLAEASRALSAVVGREGRRRMVEQIAARAGVDLPPAAAWLIVRLHENPAADVQALCEQFEIPAEVGEAALSELLQRGLIRDGAGVREVTAWGEAAAERLIEERRATLARLCEHWDPDLHPDLAGVVHRLARDLARHPARELVTPAA
jgi:hypothetical protein